MHLEGNATNHSLHPALGLLVQHLFQELLSPTLSRTQDEARSQHGDTVQSVKESALALFNNIPI